MKRVRLHRVLDMPELQFRAVDHPAIASANIAASAAENSRML
jgi:hypothetical protein